MRFDHVESGDLTAIVEFKVQDALVISAAHEHAGNTFGHALNLCAVKPSRGTHVVIGTLDHIELDRTSFALQAFGLCLAGFWEGVVVFFS